MLNKNSQFSKKSIQDIQDENFKKMSADEKVRLTLKLSSEIFELGIEQKFTRRMA
ncbi:MAG: hypothetical protein AAB366_02685 [Patescibacteria group bacterium]